MEQEIEKSFQFKGQIATIQRRMMPLKGIIYGENGVGKTTFGASSRNPIVIDMEGNCDHLDVSRFRIKSALECEELLLNLLSQNHNYNTIVVDSLDSLETLISERITNSNEDISYGRSKAVWEKHIKIFIDIFERLYLEKNMNIIFTAHVKVKAENNPMTEPYDRYALRVNEQMKTGFCNWSQFIVFALKEVLLEEKSSATFGKKKAKPIERRVIYTHGDPTYFAKNTFNLPNKMQLDWSEFVNNVKKYYNIEGKNKNDV